MKANEVINQYESKLYSVELSNRNIEQIISSLKDSMKELEKNDNELNRIRIGELKTLLNYLESF